MMWVDNLAAILAKPTDAPGLRGSDPKRVATSVLSVALNPDQQCLSTTFEPPVEIIELAGPLQLYRMYDWRRVDALGNWWVERVLLEQMVDVASRQKGFDNFDRQAFVLRLLRSSSCVHPGWKNYSDLARLDLVQGRSVPAVKGRASPRALDMSASEMERTLGDLFVPGGIQYFIPKDFIKPILVSRVQRNSPNWPFF